MWRRLGHWSVVCALIFSIGAHWAILQSMAWIGMAVSYSQQSTLREALSKTFDGLHPCKLCKVVQEGKKATKKTQTPKPLEKLELFFASQRWAVKPPAFPQISSQVPGALSAVAAAPLKPPPRRFSC